LPNCALAKASPNCTPESPEIAKLVGVKTGEAMVSATLSAPSIETASGVGKYLSGGMLRTETTWAPATNVNFSGMIRVATVVDSPRLGSEPTIVKG
jgi:hypothetical protein